MAALEEAVVAEIQADLVEKEILLPRFLHKVPMVVPEQLGPRPLIIVAAVAAVAAAAKVKLVLLALEMLVVKAEMELLVKL